MEFGLIAPVAICCADGTRAACAAALFHAIGALKRVDMSAQAATSYWPEAKAPTGQAVRHGLSAQLSHGLVRRSGSGRSICCETPMRHAKNATGPSRDGSARQAAMDAPVRPVSRKVETAPRADRQRGISPWRPKSLRSHSKCVATSDRAGPAYRRRLPTKP